MCSLSDHIKMYAYVYNFAACAPMCTDLGFGSSAVHGRQVNLLEADLKVVHQGRIGWPLLLSKSRKCYLYSTCMVQIKCHLFMHAGVNASQKACRVVNKSMQQLGPKSTKCCHHLSTAAVTL